MSAISNSETTIALTPAAVEQVRAMQGEPDNAGKALRVYVEKGGCSGMQYGLVFDEQRAGDLVTEQDGVTAVVDAFSAEYLRGSVVDFSEALTGGGFKITNPKARQSCGCGKSFET
jgi:iron-sulfur cluster assembly accessory protein